MFKNLVFLFQVYSYFCFRIYFTDFFAHHCFLHYIASCLRTFFLQRLLCTKLSAFVCLKTPSFCPHLEWQLLGYRISRPIAVFLEQFWRRVLVFRMLLIGVCITVIGRFLVGNLSFLSLFTLYACSANSGWNIYMWIYTYFYCCVYKLENSCLFNAGKFSTINLSNILCWSFSFYSFFQLVFFIFISYAVFKANFQTQSSHLLILSLTVAFLECPY